MEEESRDEPSTYEHSPAPVHNGDHTAEGTVRVPLNHDRYTSYYLRLSEALRIISEVMERPPTPEYKDSSEEYNPRNIEAGEQPISLEQVGECSILVRVQNADFSLRQDALFLKYSCICR